MLTSWLHLLALIVYLGAVVGLGLMFLSSLSGVDKHEDKVQWVARGLKYYNPLQIGALGILIFTGAFQLTELKALYREMFIKQLGYDLGIKLLFAFVLVIVSVYQSMGVGHRFIKRQESGEPVTPAELDSMLDRLKKANWCMLILGFITVWLGLRLRS
jgi:uncharacterized membrane protein